MSMNTSAPTRRNRPLRAARSTRPAPRSLRRSGTAIVAATAAAALLLGPSLASAEPVETPATTSEVTAAQEAPGTGLDLNLPGIFQVVIDGGMVRVRVPIIGLDLKIPRRPPNG